MDSKALVINPQQDIPPVTVVVGSGKHFKGVPEPGDNYSRPLMVNVWTQTTSSDFTYLAELDQQDQQYQREKELEEKTELLEENLKAHTDLLGQENEQKNTTNSNNLNYNGRGQQISPRNSSAKNLRL